MTIKISQLGNVAAIQGNVLLPIVSNITGTQTTVKTNVDQLQSYMLSNAGNVIPLASNTYSLGNSTTWWKDLWLSANTLYIGGVPIGTAGGQLTFGGNAVGTSGLDTYTGNVSASNISAGSTAIGNITTAPTFSVEGSSGNITAGNIASVGNLSTASVSTPTVTTDVVSVGSSVDFITGAVPYDGATMISAGTGYGWGQLYYPSGGTGTGLAIMVQGVSYPSGAITGYTVYLGGEGYTVGDTLTIADAGSGTAQFTIDTVTSTGTMTSGASTWTFDPAGDTTVPGNISLPDNTAIYNVDANTAVFTSNVINDTTSIYLTDTGNAAVYASDYIVLETNSDGNVSQQWAFNQNGNIRFPDATTQSTAFSNTAPIITTLGNNITQANVAMKGYVDNANVAMKGYVDTYAYSNAKVSTYLPTYSGNVGPLLNVGDFTVYGNITAGFALPAINFANVIFLGTGLANGFAQLNIQNIDSVGTNNSADFIATAPNGTDSSKYIDMGINGNNYSSSSWTVSGANDGYVYINSGNLTLGTDTQGTTVKVHVGGTLAGNVVATFANTGATVAGNIIPSANVTYSLGDATHQWKDLWVSGNTIHIGGVALSISGNTLVVNGQAQSALYDLITSNVFLEDLPGGYGNVTLNSNTKQVVFERTSFGSSDFTQFKYTLDGTNPATSGTAISLFLPELATQRINVTGNLTLKTTFVGGTSGSNAEWYIYQYR